MCGYVRQQGKLQDYIRRKYQYREFVDPARDAPLTAAEEGTTTTTASTAAAPTASTAPIARPTPTVAAPAVAPAAAAAAPLFDLLDFDGPPAPPPQQPAATPTAAVPAPVQGSSTQTTQPVCFSKPCLAALAHRCRCALPRDYAAGLALRGHPLAREQPSNKPNKPEKTGLSLRIPHSCFVSPTLHTPYQRGKAPPSLLPLITGLGVVVSPPRCSARGCLGGGWRLGEFRSVSDGTTAERPECGSRVRGFRCHRRPRCVFLCSLSLDGSGPHAI